MPNLSRSLSVLLQAGCLLCGCATGITLDDATGASNAGGAGGGGGASSAGGESSVEGGGPDGGSGQGGEANTAGGSGQGGSENVGCGDGQPDAGEQCDDGNASSTDACLPTCINAACGDGFTYAGVEACDDGNLVNGDGCSAACMLGNVFGPTHTFESLTSSFYMTQFACSQSGGDPAGDALWFCQHFYSAGCAATAFTASSNTANPMMHAGISCNDPDPAGVSITGTVCNGGPCKIGNYSGPIQGLSGIVCSCP